MTFVATALALAKRVPWQLYAAAALLLAGWMYGNWCYADGREDERAVWEARVVALKLQAAEAERRAAAAHEKRENTRVIHTETIREVARKADNANPEAAGRACGPVTSSVLGELRREAGDQQHTAPGVD